MYACHMHIIIYYFILFYFISFHLLSSVNHFIFIAAPDDVIILDQM